ncbi:hypothetical protein K502DRAFT_361514, partial [Neoconidiobolus thromboides FSU 785]
GKKNCIQACDQCKKKHRKCIFEENSCYYCRKEGNQCTYAMENNKRGKMREREIAMMNQMENRIQCIKVDNTFINFDPSNIHLLYNDLTQDNGEDSNEETNDISVANDSLARSSGNIVYDQVISFSTSMEYPHQVKSNVHILPENCSLAPLYINPQLIDSSFNQELWRSPPITTSPFDSMNYGLNMYPNIDQEGDYDLNMYSRIREGSDQDLNVYANIELRAGYNLNICSNANQSMSSYMPNSGIISNGNFYFDPYFQSSYSKSEY